MQPSRYDPFSYMLLPVLIPEEQISRLTYSKCRTREGLLPKNLPLITSYNGQNFENPIPKVELASIQLRWRGRELQFVECLGRSAEEYTIQFQAIST